MSLIPESAKHTLYGIGLVIVVINIVTVVLKSAWFKGLIGEAIIKLSANWFLDKSIYRPFHNVTLQTLDGTTQIDHIFVSPYGIFVVETKNYSGWIFGDANHSTWTQKIYRATNKFQNPLRQNYKHVKALESALDMPSDKFHSVVVFVSGTFKTPMPDNVTGAWGYIGYIKSKKNIILSDEEIDYVMGGIYNKKLESSVATSAQHVRNLRSRNDLESKQLCPKCGSDMILRTAKSGGNKFWGCSKFPACRGIKNIS